MARAFERLLRLQRGDLPRGLLLFAYLFLVIAAYLVGQVARDALFLGRFKASLLPFADLTLFLFVTAAVAVYVRAGRRLGLDRLLVGSLTLFGVVALALAVLARGTPPPLALPRRLRLGRHLRRARARPGVDPRELRPHAPRGAPPLRLRGGGSDPGRHGRGRPLERRGPALRGREPPGPRVGPAAARDPARARPLDGGGPRRSAAPPTPPGRGTGCGTASGWCWAPPTCGRSPGSWCSPRS